MDPYIRVGGPAPLEEFIDSEIKVKGSFPLPPKPPLPQPAPPVKMLFCDICCSNNQNL